MIRLVRQIVPLLLIPLSLCAQDKAGKPTVTFDGTTFLLASSTDNPTGLLKEYLPDGQDLESWTKLAALHEYPNVNDPRAMAENVVRVLKQRNPAAQSAMIQNPKTGEVILDFVTWPADSAFVEFNIFRYSRKPGGGLIAQQYALREYKNQSEFLTNLKTLRPRLVELMAKNGLQAKP